MTELSDKMRALASSGHPRAEELIDAADKFDNVIDGNLHDPSMDATKRMLGVWARARKLWAECSGKQLI